MHVLIAPLAALLGARWPLLLGLVLAGPAGWWIYLRAMGVPVGAGDLLIALAQAAILTAMAWALRAGVVRLFGARQQRNADNAT